ncbi:MAG: hypothetical protein G01um101417_360 [Parcubacteria group bacterium Gr01-1014_17]|nr:MAG: hypothetical protein G01um101417_360 [Parcubacteria group bacterium Gr01-1014_17]
MPPTFIPRQTAAAQNAQARHARVSVFFYLSAGAFAISLLAAGGVFFYQKILANRLVKMNNDLVAARAAFEPAFIEELQRMDTRLESAKALLAQHRAVSPLFVLLERETLATVRFTKFGFSEVPEGGVRIALGGEAASFNAVALQSDVFAKNGSFLDPVFSDFDVDKSGTVHFSFTATVAPEFVLYRSHLASMKKPSAQTPQKQNGVAGQAAGVGGAPAKPPAVKPPSGDVEFGDDILF